MGQAAERITDIREKRQDAAAQSLLVTPELAHEWLRTKAYDGQRPLSKAHVEYLVEVMRRGEYKPSVVEFRALDGREYLINGQHSLQAIVRGGLAQTMFVLTQAAPDLDAVARDYARCDRGRGRNLKDVFTAFGLSDELRLPGWDVQALGAAVQVIANGFGVHHGSGYSGKSAERRVQAMREWAEEMRLYSAAVQGAQSTLGRRLRMGAVAGVALVTLRHQREQAHGFWREVALNDGLRRGQPAHTLVEYLLDVGRYGRPHEGTLERACARAWNAHYEGRGLEKIVGTDRGRPITLLGTPYTGQGS